MKRWHERKIEGGKVAEEIWAASWLRTKEEEGVVGSGSNRLKEEGGGQRVMALEEEEDK